jgi:6-phosphogluconolactonase/glucosamine-6-phosphate isomerase/deaminase
MFEWFKPKEKFVEVGYGWPSYSNEYVTITHDRKNSKWIFTWEDEYIDRPRQYSMDKSYITFTKDAIESEKEYVRAYFKGKFHKLTSEVI